MNREILDRWLERGILGVVLGILVLGPLAFGAVHGLVFGTITVLAAIVMVFWVARIWCNSRPRFLWPPICWAVLAFLLYAVVRYRNADIEYVARSEVLRVLLYGFLFFAI